MTRTLTFLPLLCLFAGSGQASEPPAVTGAHADLACEDCHVEKELADCDECHDAEANIHPVGMVPSIQVPVEFSVGSGGELLCRSCHRLHGGDPGAYFLRGPVEDRSAFCARCHGEQMARTNPHQARQGTARCAFCHTSVAGEALGGRGTARQDIVKLCDFCHGALAKDHPRNIDPALSFPKDLPLAPDGSWTCVTCHNPHGTTDTTHYVRAAFARHFERGRQESPHVETYFACRGCHTTSDPDEIRPPNYRLRYKGDINVLCVSCHVTDRGHHPTGLPPPPFMVEDIEASGKPVPLDKKGRIDCYTCHDNSCDTGRQKMRVRFYDPVDLKSDLCWICHPREQFAKVNPHSDDPALCTHCHESIPIPGVRKGLMTIPKMVCLRCHDVNPHPASADHLRKPSDKINPDESLPLGAGGDVTCVTCHNPHATPELTPRRLRADPQGLCELCHWR